MGVAGSNGATSGWAKSKMAAGRHLVKFRVAISLQPCHLYPFGVWFSGKNIGNNTRGVNIDWSQLCKIFVVFKHAVVADSDYLKIDLQDDP